MAYGLARMRVLLVESAPNLNSTVEWLQLATSRSVVGRACRVAVIVGGALVAINHGDALLQGDISLGRGLRILFTAIVPYCVSTYSSVTALREHIAAEHT